MSKIDDARLKLKHLHQGDPAHAADQELYQAIQDALADVNERLIDLERPKVIDIKNNVINKSEKTVDVKK